MENVTAFGQQADLVCVLELDQANRALQSGTIPDPELLHVGVDEDRTSIDGLKAAAVGGCAGGGGGVSHPSGCIGIKTVTDEEGEEDEEDDGKEEGDENGTEVSSVESVFDGWAGPGG